MLLITGGAGFIGSALVWALNEKGLQDIVVSDHLGLNDKWQNLAKRRLLTVVPKNHLWQWLEEEGQPKFDAVFHLGACSTTTERDADYLLDNNVRYSQKLWQYCTQKKIPFLYASSAATYGAEELRFSDQHLVIPSLRPINKYGWSKQLFDAWALAQTEKPPFWAGFKFFNVYGPQEYHKGPQASVCYHAFSQIQNRGKLRLFQSYRPDIAHGEQKRDFVYVKDVVSVLLHFWQEKKRIPSGIYNLGSGRAQSFVELGRAMFEACEVKPDFEWIEMPASLIQQYQYFTEADLNKLRNDAGYQKPFYTIESGALDYVRAYLKKPDPYL